MLISSYSLVKEKVQRLSAYKRKTVCDIYYNKGEINMTAKEVIGKINEIVDELGVDPDSIDVFIDDVGLDVLVARVERSRSFNLDKNYNITGNTDYIVISRYPYRI